MNIATIVVYIATMNIMRQAPWWSEHELMAPNIAHLPPSKVKTAKDVDDNTLGAGSTEADQELDGTVGF